MCKGQDPPDFTQTSPINTLLRRRTAEAELAAARARLAASVEALRRQQERAVELLRRVEESIAERERLRKVVAVMDVVRAHLVEARLREIRVLIRSRR
jgi:ATP/maltotriose-dependent transcriptional regulator MalT